MSAKKPPLVDCPNCAAKVVYNKDFPFRPFCSKRCKDADFIDWAHESKRIKGNASYDDLFSEREEEIN
ncbi:MAG: DNA gyrase inhibitor YacG [Gammaproteobacteria bacterium]|nr:DNA gyrase inhibitor YacG [Gammaproteobacteria bacterium]NND39088.1 DNA gyrase inhibitor YacG [Pseudomonadales bacterium]NNM10595.1 DNA gyrase inhibitor YacG [Pseudomonadales bacterium]RZV57958.1 MAG: DNA gyrase inhibitor YacG [Pseudomonadales bacterium]